MVSGDDDFLIPDEAPQRGPDNVIPFPRMRPNPALSDAWRRDVDEWNKKNGTHHKFLKPLDIVPELLEIRALPQLVMPARWPRLALRIESYPGDVNGIVGSIGGGKTSFALEIALANSADGAPVIWDAVELGPAQVLTRQLGSLHGVHASHVRKQWSEEQIRHGLAAVHDMWTFMDRIDDIAAHMAATRDLIALCWKRYRRPPVLVVDHPGELIATERDERQAMLSIAHGYRKMTEEARCFTLLLAQVSVANQSSLTGRNEVDAATELLGIETGGKALASVCANTMGCAVFKADDAVELDAQVLVTKARHSGREGREGFRFLKAGGRWRELDYLPATPSAVRAEVEKDKRDKHRTEPPRSPAEAARDINLSRAGDAEARARVEILKVLQRHGALGMDYHTIRGIQGAGRSAGVQQRLQELERAGSVEKLPGNRWRILTRST